MRKRKVFVRLLVFIIMLGLGVSSVYFLQEIRYKDIIENMQVTHDNEMVQLMQELQKPKTGVYVFSRDISQGQIITENDMFLAQIETEVAATNVIENKEDVVGKILKINVSQNQPVTEYISYTIDDIPADLREKEFVSFKLPTKLVAGDTVDVRIQFPTGQDYIVLSKKVVYDRQQDINPDNNEVEKETVWIHLSEEEITYISSAIVDAYLNEAKIYAIEYIDPYIQEAATVNYPLNFAILELLANNNGIAEAIDRGDLQVQLDNRTSLEDVLAELRDNDEYNFTNPDIKFNEDEDNDKVEEKDEETEPETDSSDEIEEDTKEEETSSGFGG